MPVMPMAIMEFFRASSFSCLARMVILVSLTSEAGMGAERTSTGTASSTGTGAAGAGAAPRWTGMGIKSA